MSYRKPAGLCSYLDLNPKSVDDYVCVQVFCTKIDNKYISDTCSCNVDTCLETRDCCADVDVPPHNTSTTSPVCATQFKGGSHRTRFPFFVYDQCPEEFQNKDIRDLCSTPIDGDNSKPGKGGVHFSSHQADEK